MMTSFLSIWPQFGNFIITILLIAISVIATVAMFWMKKYIDNLKETITGLKNDILKKEKELKELIDEKCEKLVSKENCGSSYSLVKQTIEKLSEEMETGDEMFETVSNQLTQIGDTLTSNNKKLNTIGRALSVTSKTLVKLCEKDPKIDCSDVAKLADVLDDSQWSDLKQ